jgi:hypothetical protein
MSVPLVITAVENEEKQRAKEESRNLPEHVVAVDGSEHSERCTVPPPPQTPVPFSFLDVHVSLSSPPRWVQSVRVGVRSAAEGPHAGAGPRCAQARVSRRGHAGQ